VTAPHSTQALVAAIAADIAAAQIIVVQPAYLEALVRHGGMAEDRAGYTLSLEMLAFAIATIAMVGVISRVRWRPLLMFALGTMALAHAASGYLVHTELFLASRVLVGLAAGVVVPLAFAAVGLGPNPERGFGIMIGAVLSYGALALAVAPALTSAGGLQGLQWMFAAVGGLALLLARHFPEPPAAADGHVERERRTARGFEWFALLAMAAYFAAQSCFWAYASLVGQHFGLAETSVAHALAISQFAGIAGAAVPALLATRLGQASSLTAGILCGSVPLLLLVPGLGETRFLIVICLFQFGWNATHPFLLGVFARFDRTGQVVVQGTAMQKIGLAFGPAAAAYVLKPDLYQHVVWLSMALGAIALALVLPAAFAQRKLAD
jgi:predicted MFS family arabinose efflux permease